MVLLDVIFHSLYFPNHLTWPSHLVVQVVEIAPNLCGIEERGNGEIVPLDAFANVEPVCHPPFSFADDIKLKPPKHVELHDV